MSLRKLGQDLEIGDVVLGRGERSVVDRVEWSDGPYTSGVCLVYFESGIRMSMSPGATVEVEGGEE